MHQKEALAERRLQSAESGVNTNCRPCPGNRCSRRDDILVIQYVVARALRLVVAFFLRWGFRSARYVKQLGKVKVYFTAAALAPAPYRITEVLAPTVAPP